MANRIEINDEQLDNVNGGAITYTWDGKTGSLGMDGNNTYILLDKAAFLNVYNQMFGKYSDLDIIKELRKKGIIKKP